MARVAVVHTSSKFGSTDLIAGERFRVVDEPQDITDTLLLMEIHRRGDEDNVVAIDLGESYAVMTLKPDAEGRSLASHFILEGEK